MVSPKPPKSLDDHRKQFQSDAAAARHLGLGYHQYRRWLQRHSYSPDNSAWRIILLDHHNVELPRRPVVSEVV
jgi:hypothetical protein